MKYGTWYVFQSFLVHCNVCEHYYSRLQNNELF